MIANKEKSIPTDYTRVSIASDPVASVLGLFQLMSVHTRFGRICFFVDSVETPGDSAFFLIRLMHRGMFSTYASDGQSFWDVDQIPIAGEELVHPGVVAVGSYQYILSINESILSINESHLFRCEAEEMVKVMKEFSKDIEDAKS